MRTHIVFIVWNILIFSCMYCYGQSEISIPKEFKGTNIPRIRSGEWLELNASFYDFKVKMTDGKLEIKEHYPNKARMELPNGTLIGVDKGEEGGELSFLPDSAATSIKIKDGSIKYIFAYNNKIYFIEGTAFLWDSYGALYELIPRDKSFSYIKRIDFEDAPEAFTIYNDQWLIAGHQNFYIIKDSKKQTIFKDQFWNGLYPNSIAVLDEKNVFVGIRGGIVLNNAMQSQRSVAITMNNEYVPETQKKHPGLNRDALLYYVYVFLNTNYYLLTTPYSSSSNCNKS